MKKAFCAVLLLVLSGCLGTNKKIEMNSKPSLWWQQPVVAPVKSPSLDSDAKWQGWSEEELRPQSPSDWKPAPKQADKAEEKELGSDKYL